MAGPHSRITSGATEAVTHRGLHVGEAEASDWSARPNPRPMESHVSSAAASGPAPR